MQPPPTPPKEGSLKTMKQLLMHEMINTFIRENLIPVPLPLGKRVGDGLNEF